MPLFQLFTVLVGVAVVLLLATALAAIWERLRGDSEVKTLERDNIERLEEESSPSVIPEKPKTGSGERRSRKARAKKNRSARHKV
jgi:uncharacterized membrane protein YccC